MKGDSMTEEIKYKEKLLAFIIRSSYKSDGIKFFTPDSYSQQLGYMNRGKGYIIEPHVHIPFAREVAFTKEVLFIKSGSIRIDFYNEDQEYLESKILNSGDVILLAYGGHGIEVLEEVEMIEVKQGPYAGTLDKKRFNPIDKNDVVYL